MLRQRRRRERMRPCSCAATAQQQTRAALSARPASGHAPAHAADRRRPACAAAGRAGGRPRPQVKTDGLDVLQGWQQMKLFYDHLVVNEPGRPDEAARKLFRIIEGVEPRPEPSTIRRRVAAILATYNRRKDLNPNHG